MPSPEQLQEVLAKISELVESLKEDKEPLDNCCSIKYLDSSLFSQAAENAISINPINGLAFGPVTQFDGGVDPQRLSVMVSKYWGPKPRQLTVSFMDNPPSDLRRRILSHMNSWTKTGCISFVETQSSGDVRISRGNGGYYSYLGTDILLVSKNTNTMNLQGFTMNTPESEFIRVVRHETGHCMSGNTLIDCPRDLNKYPLGIPIKDLVGKQPYVYAWKDGSLVVRKASKVWLTKLKAKVVRVKLSPGKGYKHNGKYFPPQELVGTPDHLVLLSDGKTWKALGSLKKGDRLCSMYRSSNGERTRIRWTGNEGAWEHPFVCEQIYGPRPYGYDCHHKNENKLDQSPENLEWKDAFSHRSEHSKGRKRRKLSKEHIAKLIECNKNRVYTDEIRAKMSESAKTRPPISKETSAKISAASKGRKPSQEALEKRRESMLAFYSQGNRSGMYGKKASEETRAKHRENWRKRKAAKVNHTVVSVEDAGFEDVYDMTVPGANSFMANGVGCHNSMGFPHEHMRRQIIAKLDPEKTYEYFRRTQGWDRQTVNQQVLTPLEEASIRGTIGADQDSIMCYQLPGQITIDGRPIRGGMDINEDDYSFCAKIYPKQTTEPPPPTCNCSAHLN
jgi:hypothetical protein